MRLSVTDTAEAGVTVNDGFSPDGINLFAITVLDGVARTGVNYRIYKYEEVLCVTGEIGRAHV